MPIPDFQAVMLPLLHIASDGTDHSLGDAIEQLAQHFALTPEDQAHLLPSGRQPTFNNRVGWAATHLRKALLLEKAGHGRFRITARGQRALHTAPPIISMAFLSQWPEYQEFRKSASVAAVLSPSPSSSGSAIHEPSQQTPRETLESGYATLRQSLVDELLDRMKTMAPARFEQLVIDLLVAMGYGGSRRDAGEVVGRSGDGGIDGIIKEDKLGLDLIYIQAKRWQGNVGFPSVAGFVGSLAGVGANKGVMITTSSFTADARAYVNKIAQKIVLIDGQRLAQLMIDHDIGVTVEQTYIVKRIDSDYFEE